VKRLSDTKPESYYHADARARQRERTRQSPGGNRSKYRAGEGAEFKPNRGLPEVSVSKRSCTKRKSLDEIIVVLKSVERRHERERGKKEKAASSNLRVEEKKRGPSENRFRGAVTLNVEGPSRLKKFHLDGRGDSGGNALKFNS